MYRANISYAKEMRACEENEETNGRNRKGTHHDRGNVTGHRLPTGLADSKLASTKDRGRPCGQKQTSWWLLVDQWKGQSTHRTGKKRRKVEKRREHLYAPDCLTCRSRFQDLPSWRFLSSCPKWTIHIPERSVLSYCYLDSQKY